ncbi:MAG: hypothetical protein M1840_001180 [Geoglossum simile]|nr:MAG: hypothetical protein M1840_001180 [Geoglossum simile]
MVLPNEDFWRIVQRVPKLAVPKLDLTRNISGYFAWCDGVENAVNEGLATGWGFVTGSIKYPSGSGSGSDPLFPALKKVVDEGLDYMITSLPDLQGKANYVEWKGNMRVFMEARGLYGYFDGSIPWFVQGGKAQPADDTPPLLDPLLDGLRNWRRGTLEKLTDDQKIWLLADKLVICAIYTTCSVRIQEFLSFSLERDELKTSCDVLQFLNEQCGPSKSHLELFTHLNTIRREDYRTHQEFVSAFKYGVRACKAAGLEISEASISVCFFTSLGYGDQDTAMREAVEKFINGRLAAGLKLELWHVLAVAQCAEEARRPRAPPPLCRSGWGWNWRVSLGVGNCYGKL